MKPVVASTAYLLVSHGSRDPRPQEAMNQLAELVRQRLDQSSQPEYFEGSAPSRVVSAVVSDESSGQLTSVLARSQSPRPQSSGSERSPLLDKVPTPSTGATSSNVTSPNVMSSNVMSSNVIVGTACLELSVLSLREQIYAFGCRLVATGVTELKILPVFLMAGVHVMEDIPAEIAAAREQLGDDIQLTVCDHLGSHPDISSVLKQRFASVPAENSLLVAHGSRRPRGNKGIEKLAKQLNTQVAYWAVPPDIETQVIELMQKGCQRLTILPYFLFAGGITDAIAHRTEELAERFPKVQFRLLPTLGATAEMAALSVEMIQAA